MTGLGSLYAQQQQRGKASYYSKRANGARTSSGERLNNDSMVCAHRTYPFGTLLKVTNLSNDNWVIVRVIDRGPFGRGRVIDLSYAAAKKLGMLSQGIASVLVEPADQVVIPFRMEDKQLMPEFDFEIDDRNASEIPSWKDYKKLKEMHSIPSKRLPKPKKHHVDVENISSHAKVSSSMKKTSTSPAKTTSSAESK